ncbi:MAG: DUF808 domain-containing protein [Desulfuromonas sp.]|nr:DUF808 domain-containing protein [Desulfuromonas sp.]
MSGLLALLDDVAAIAKVAEASVDDVIGQAAKAGSKAAAALIDDAAVTPKYVHGFDSSRELPIVGRIALGSIKNKLVFLLPAGLALSNFAPWAISPLLMLGGAYLCFEGAEKIAHVVVTPQSHGEDLAAGNAVHLEEAKVAGAIKTDFILSAEIMTIALAAIPANTFWMEAAILAVVGVGITALVYGSVALIVKADDLGLLMSNKGQISMVRALGRAIVHSMPRVLALLMIIGTAAMLWVGGSIVIHGCEEMGYGWLGHHIHDWSAAVGHVVPQQISDLTQWSVKATLDGVFGLSLGLALLLVGNKVIAPILAKRFWKNKRDVVDRVD